MPSNTNNLLISYKLEEIKNFKERLQKAEKLINDL